MLPESLKRLRAEHPVQTLDLGNLRWKLIDAGSGGVPLLMLPGALGSADSFYKQIFYFSRQRRVISANYPLSSDLDALAASLEALLEHLNIDEVILFGTSLGGYIAQRFNERKPKAVRKLIIGNSFKDASRLLSTPLFDPALAKTRSAKDLLALWRQRIENNVTTQGSSELSDVILDFLQNPDNADQLQARLLTLANADRRIGESADQVVIIDCENDQIVDQETRRECRHRYPNARIHSLSDGGHYPYILNADRFNDILDAEMSDVQIALTPEAFSK